MSKATVRLIVDLTVHEGHFDEFTGIAREMVAGSREEPGTLGYEWFVSGDRKLCRLVETYVDARAVLAHFAGPVVQQIVPKILKHAKLERFQFFGDPGPEVAAKLAAFGAEIFEPWYGFNR